MKHYKFFLEKKNFEVITYPFDELPEMSKQKAIQDHFDFLNSFDNPVENQDEVIENIRINEYEYDFKGDLVGITIYMKDNKPTGKKTIKINKKEIDLIEIL